MVVRVDAVVAPTRAAEQLVRAVRDDLVHVHVDRGAAAAVHDVDRELAAVPAGRDLVGRRHDRRRDLRREVTRPEIGACGRCLDVAERRHQLALAIHRHARHPEVRERTLGVRAVQRPRRYLDRPERVVLLPGLHVRIHTRVARSGSEACPDP